MTSGFGLLVFARIKFVWTSLNLAGIIRLKYKTEVNEIKVIDFYDYQIITGSPVLECSISEYDFGRSGGPESCIREKSEKMVKPVKSR